MENIINIPGLQHLAEKVFLNLEHKDLKVCGKINQSSKQILAHPKFWLKKFVSLGMSKKNKTDWTKAIQSVKNSMMKKQIILYLKWRLKKKKNIDLPCYTSNTVQDSFKKQIRRAARKGHTKIVKILAPLTDNPNAPDKDALKNMTGSF